MRVLSLKNIQFSRKKRKKRNKPVKKLPETYYRDYSLCESAHKALSIIAEIDKKPKKRMLDQIIYWFYEGYYRNKVMKRANLFTHNNPEIKPDEIKYYKKNHITKKANDCLSYIAQNEGMSRKKCLDKIILWYFSYYMGMALQENNTRRMVNELLPKNVRKVRPSLAVRYLRKKAVEAGIGSYPTIVRKGL